MEDLSFINLTDIVEEAKVINTQLILGTLHEETAAKEIQFYIEKANDIKVAAYALALANFTARNKALFGGNNG